LKRKGDLGLEALGIEIPTGEKEDSWSVRRAILASGREKR
jgi:hypothetical protein